jgi:anti-anti-sigma regulatory factor
MATVLRTGESLDAAALCAQLRALVRGGATRVVCDLGALVAPDARSVEALARLQLAARRLGCTLQLRRVSAELQELLAFMGLADVVLRVEVRRQAEDREQRLGVEEERELDDPVT